MQGLEKSYKELHVLRGVDFDVARGSIFALLGSNGAGKTTVVKILSTLLKADAGTATRQRLRCRRRRPADVRESISLTGQFAAVDEILTGRENLVLVARLRHLQEPGHDRGRPARPLLAHRRGRPEGGDVLGWHAPPPRHRDEPDREPAGHLPRRADDRARPRRRASRCGRPSRSSPSSGTTVLLTTQYLDEAEQLADRIAILHEGRIIVNGTLAELKQLLPPAKVEYVEKQPTLEDVFLALVGDDGKDGDARRPQRPHGRVRNDDDHALLRRHRRPDRAGPCATSRAARTPSSRPRSRRSPSCCCSSTCSAARSTPGRTRTSNYLLPGILLITIASGIAYTAFRLFLDMQSGIFERFQSMPIARSSVLWAHVLTSLVANLISLVVVVRRRPAHGLPHRARECWRGSRSPAS